MHNTPNSWIKCNVKYSRDLVESGLEGVRSARENLFAERPLTTVLTRSARRSIAPALIGASLGVLCGYLGSRRKTAGGKVLACSLLGGAIGFGAGMVWETRSVAEGMAHSAMKSMKPVRDAHWLARHPITYA